MRWLKSLICKHFGHRGKRPHQTVKMKNDQWGIVCHRCGEWFL